LTYVSEELTASVISQSVFTRLHGAISRKTAIFSAVVISMVNVPPAYLEEINRIFDVNYVFLQLVDYIYCSYITLGK
jgi:hypothetical protein